MKPLHIFIAVCCGIIWGGNILAHKIGVQHFSPLTFSCLRSLLLVPLCFFVPRPKVPWIPLILISFSFGVVMMGGLSLGVSFGISTGAAALITQSGSFFLVILSALLLKQPPLTHQVIGISIGFMGIALIAQEMGMDATLFGFLFILTACLG